MAATANYGWVKPTVGGDSGAWGSIANTIFDAIDTAVKARETEAGKALSELLGFPPLYVPGRVYIDDVNNSKLFTDTANYSRTGSLFVAGGSASGAAYTGASQVGLFRVYIPGLRPNHRITGFTSFGNKTTAGSTATVSLRYINKSGVVTTVSAGHSLPVSASPGLIGTQSSTTTSGLTHDVIADVDYFFQIDWVRPGPGSDMMCLGWIQPTVTRP